MYLQNQPNNVKNGPDVVRDTNCSLQLFAVQFAYVRELETLKYANLYCMTVRPSLFRPICNHGHKE